MIHGSLSGRGTCRGAVFKPPTRAWPGCVPPCGTYHISHAIGSLVLLLDQATDCVVLLQPRLLEGRLLRRQLSDPGRSHQHLEGGEEPPRQHGTGTRRGGGAGRAIGSRGGAVGGFRTCSTSLFLSCIPFLLYSTSASSCFCSSLQRACASALFSPGDEDMDQCVGVGS